MKNSDLSFLYLGFILSAVAIILLIAVKLINKSTKN